jgi:hypothetical protein
MKRLVRKNRFAFFLALFCLFLSYSSWATDFPIERDFLKLPDKRWIWLEKVDLHKTRVILGKGEKSYKNHIWSKIYETDGQYHTWAYAFFVRIRPGRFIDTDPNGDLRVAVSTTDLGTNLIRYAIIYRVKKDKLEWDREVPGFNAVADGPVFTN